jgi:hypothetical protein
MYFAHNGEEEKIPPLGVILNESYCAEVCGSLKLQLKLKQRDEDC